MLQIIAKDYASIGSIFSYMGQMSGVTRTVPVHAEPGYYVKPEVIESMQQELAALKDSTALLQRDVKVNQAQWTGQSQQQYAAPRFDNRQMQQVRIQPRPNANNCFYCLEPGHIVRDWSFAKDHIAKGKWQPDANGNVPWNQLLKELANLLAKDRVEQQGKVQNLYTGVDDEFDRSLWEMQVASPDPSYYLNNQGNDDAHMWMEHAKVAEQQNMQWQKMMQQQHLQAKPVEPVMHQFLNAAPSSTNVSTPHVPHPQVSSEPLMVEMMKAMINKLDKVIDQSGSGFWIVRWWQCMLQGLTQAQHHRRRTVPEKPHPRKSIKPLKRKLHLKYLKWMTMRSRTPSVKMNLRGHLRKDRTPLGNPLVRVNKEWTKTYHLGTSLK